MGEPDRQGRQQATSPALQTRPSPEGMGICPEKTGRAGAYLISHDSFSFHERRGGPGVVWEDAERRQATFVWAAGPRQGMPCHILYTHTGGGAGTDSLLG